MAKAALAFDFRVVMIGKNQEEKAKLGTFLTAKSIVPYGKLSKQSSVFFGQWARKSVKVYNTSDLFSADDAKAAEEVRLLRSVCDPNAFLLLVDPSDFSRADRDKLRAVLQRFGDDALRCSVLLMTEHDTGQNSHFNGLKQDCGHRLLRLDFNELHGFDQKSLMDKLQGIIDDNQSVYDTFARQMEQPLRSEPIYDYPRVVLNLVLCGGFDDWKALASKAILGRKPNKMKNVCTIGRQTVSIVELPALSSLNPDAARRECEQCLSLCEPAGVHAFVLVQPVGPLVPEDKLELDAIRREFTSKMNTFKMILFPVDSESGALAVSNFIRSSKDVQELCASCNDRYVILNISDKQRVPDVIRMVEQMSEYGSRSYRKSEAEHQLRRESSITLNPHKETVRIVLIGKTGSGKSATANTLLGRDEFESKLSQTSVTKFCRKAEGWVGGRSVEIVDTPGLFDTALSNRQVQEELVKCVSLLAPGPHVFLLVLEIGRFTQEERETVQLIQSFFGAKSDKYTIVLFTRGDYLNNTSIEDYLEGGGTQEMLEKCGNRYQVFNNHDKQNRRQVHELLDKIDAMVAQNGGGYYTSEIFQEAEKAIEKQTKRILQQRAPEIEKQKRAIEERHKQLVKFTKSKISAIKNTFDQEIFHRDKQVREKQRKMEIEREKKKRFEEKREEEDRILKMEEKKQLQKWNERYNTLLSSNQDNQQPYGRLRRLSLALEEFKREKTAWEQQRDALATRAEDEEQRREEVYARLATLEGEYEDAKRLYDAKIREDELLRKQEEQEVRAVEEIYLKQLEAVHQKSYEEARKQAEESNEFQDKYTKEVKEDKVELERQLEQMRQRQKANDDFLLRQLTRSKSYLKDYNTLRERQRQEIRALGRLQGIHDADFLMRGVEELRKQHDDEVHDWIQRSMRSAAESNACAIL